MLFKPGPIIKQYAIVNVANFTFLHLGLSVGWMSPTMAILSNPNQTVLPEPLTQKQISWILSVSFLVDVFAFLFSGYLTDTIGRKYSIIISSIPRIVACLLFTFSSRVWMLILGRVCCGLSDAFTVTVISTYTSEIASKEIRGGLGTVSQMWSTFGAMILLAVGPFVSYNAINNIHISIVLVTWLMLLLLPESPYFLHSKGHTDKAIDLLTSLRGSKSLAYQEVDDYTKSAEKTSKRDLLLDKDVLKTLAKVIFIMICAQFTGNGFTTFNLQLIFEMTNTNVSPGLSSLVIGFVSLAATFCTMYLSDRFGKKPVLTISIIGQCIGMVGLGTFFKMTENSDVTGFLNYLPLISLILSNFCFCSGLGSLMYILCAEMLHGGIRAFGISSGICTACIFIFLNMRFVPDVMATIGLPYTYWIFAAFCLIECIFISFFIPETKGKTFLQIQNELRNCDQIKK